MKVKSFIISYGTFLIVTMLLYWIGNVANIEWMSYHSQYKNTNNNSYFDFSMSFFPPIVGLISCFFAEKMYIKK